MGDLVWGGLTGAPGFTGPSRLWEVRPGEYTVERITHPVQAIHAQRGLVFNCSTGVLTGTGHFKVALENKAGSGRHLCVYRLTTLVAAKTSDLLFIHVRINPTLTGLTARTPGNSRIGSPEQSVARLHSGVGADFTGGLPSQAGVPCMTNSVRSIDLTLIVPPGVTFGLSAALPKDASAVVTFWWYESLPELVS